MSKFCDIQLVREIIKLARDMEARQIGGNGSGRKGVEGSDHVEIKENEEVLKKIIATHPLYEVLIQSHISCLKVINFPFSFLLPFAIFSPLKTIY